MKRYIIICFLSTSLFNLICQNNFKSDIKEVSKYMNKLKRYSVTLKYQMYLDGNFTKPYQTRSIFINQDVDKMSLKQGEDFEIIETTNEHINVSHRNKSVYYVHYEKNYSDAENEENNIDKIYQQLAENYDSLYQSIEKVSLISKKSNVKEYEIIFKEGEYTKMQIGMDVKTKLYTQIIVNYREKTIIDEKDPKPKNVCLKVIYENYNTAPVFGTETFNISKYISGKNTNKVTLTPKIKNYKLIVF